MRVSRSRDVEGFNFPLLSDPQLIAKLLFTDEAVPLVTYDIPRLEYGYHYFKFIPILGTIGAVFGGG